MELYRHGQLHELAGPVDLSEISSPQWRNNRPTSAWNTRCAAGRPCIVPARMPRHAAQENLMTDPREHLVDWVRDAYAMEKQAESMLKAQASRLDHYPMLRERIEQHLDETLSQQRLLEGCLDRLGSSPSAMKDLTARIAAFGQALGGMTMTDEVVKGAMSGYVFEQIEVAAYTALIEAARAVGDAETLRCCETILPQEVEMGRWLLEHLPGVVNEYLSRSQVGVAAKR
jgi:ferritin-like metal-binding protein YciE